jgi:cell division protein FtsI (penicillin-binding protein 3)
MTIAYGHGVAVSPLQLAAAAAATLNGGLFHPPTIVKRPADEPTLGWRVISQRTSRQLRALMHLVVTRGTGKKAAVPGYLVGGKTGSADKPGKRGYRRKALISSFVAGFPIDAPRYIVFVMYDEPHGTKATFNYATGGWTAAPAVGRIISRIGPMAGIAPLSVEADTASRRLLVEVAGIEEPSVAF